MNFKSDLHKIKAFAFDVDGVLTDGSVLVSEGGDFLRIFNSKDGYAIRYAVLQGFHVAIITGGGSETIRKRFNALDVFDIYLKSFKKLPDFNNFCEKYGLSHDEVLVMGDDIPDIDLLKVCGMPTCPVDAVPEVKAVSRYISHFEGGRGCARDVIEQVLKVQGKWIPDTGIISA